MELPSMPAESERYQSISIVPLESPGPLLVIVTEGAIVSPELLGSGNDPLSSDAASDGSSASTWIGSLPETFPLESS